MKKQIAAAVLALACAGAEAGVLYVWSALCVYRTTFDGIEETDLGCPVEVRGFLEMPDGYVPGSAFETGDGPEPLFTMFNYDFEPLHIRDLPLTHPTSIVLPEWNGPGHVSWVAPNASFSNDLFAIENPYPGGSMIQMTWMRFTRVAEPPAWALVMSALGLLLGTALVRPRANRACGRPA